MVQKGVVRGVRMGAAAYPDPLMCGGFGMGRLHCSRRCGGGGGGGQARRCALNAAMGPRKSGNSISHFFCAVL